MVTDESGKVAGEKKTLHEKTISHQDPMPVTRGCEVQESSYGLMVVLGSLAKPDFVLVSCHKEIWFLKKKDQASLF